MTQKIETENIWFAVIIIYDDYFKLLKSYQKSKEEEFRSQIFILSYFIGILLLASHNTNFDVISDYMKKFRAIWKEEWFNEWDTTDLPAKISMQMEFYLFKSSQPYLQYWKEDHLRTTHSLISKVITLAYRQIIYGIPIGRFDFDTIKFEENQDLMLKMKELFMTQYEFFSQYLMTIDNLNLNMKEFFFERTYDDEWLKKIKKKNKDELDKNISSGVESCYPQKYFLKLLSMAGITDLLLLIIALINATNHNLPDGYYTFLRIVTCGLFVWLAILHKSPYWRFILGAGAILYNPVFPIHLDSRDPWIFFNILSIVVLVPAFILYIKTAKVNSNDAEKTK